MAFCAFNFGFDVGIFGGVQVMQSSAEEDIQFEIEIEIASLRYANANEHKRSWAEVFDKKNRVSLRRIRSTYTR